MFVRWPIAVLVVPALLVVGCGGDDDSDGSGNGHAAAPIAGDWAGTLKQKGLSAFQIAVEIDSSGSGRVAYTGIECGGTWTLPGIVDSKPPQYEFHEQIEEGVGGNCKGSGRVSIHPELLAPKEILHYVFTGGGVKSKGLLHRTDASGLQPIFDEAGVSPP